MALEYNAHDVERWRERAHKRSPHHTVSTKRRALNFINTVGFCLVFRADGDEVPSLWHAVHGNPKTVPGRADSAKSASAFLWEMKHVLPSERLVYYGKLLMNRPTMLSLDILPYFYALSGRTGDRDEYIHCSNAWRSLGPGTPHHGNLQQAFAAFNPADPATASAERGGGEGHVHTGHGRAPE